MYPTLFSLVAALLLAAPVLAQEATPTSVPEVPEYLQSIQTEEDFEALTPEQQEETLNFFNSVGPGALAQASPAAPEGTVSCFDYYTFGSVQVSVSPSVGSTVSGVPITFTGTLDNENPYPVVDGAVYMKVFKLSGDGTTPVNGYDVVDQRFVADNLSLQANEQQPVTLTWDVPAGLPTGDYQAAFFFTSAKRFNLLGLPFTDDVVGNTVSFSVVGELADGVAFDKDSVTVDGSDYYFAAFTPKVDSSAPIALTADLTNTTDSEQTVPVTFTTYAWDQQRQENIVRISRTEVTLASNSTETLTHTVTDTESSVYLVVAEAKYYGTKSILNVRFTRSDIPSIRINFPAVTSYPLVAGEEATLFSCLHGAGTMPLVEGGTLELSLADESGQTLHTYTYEGSITGAMMAVKDTFTPKETLETFTLTASLSRDGTLVDRVDMHYDCSQLGGCTPVEMPVMPDMTHSSSSTMTLIYTIVGLAVLALVVMLVMKFNNRNSDDDLPTSSDEPKGPVPPVAMLLALVVVGGLFLMTVGEVQAESRTVSSAHVGQLCYTPTVEPYVGTTPDDVSMWAGGLSDPIATVGYSANVYDDDTGILLSPGSTVSVGQRLRLVQSLGGVSWLGTGWANDTPAGVWKNDAGFPDGPTGTVERVVQWTNGLPSGWRDFRTAQCSPEFYTLTAAGTNIYIPFSAKPPTQRVEENPSGTANLSCAGNVCEVLSAGTINLDFVFESTYGMFYYEYEYVGDPGVCLTSWYLNPMRASGDSYAPSSMSCVNTSVFPMAFLPVDDEGHKMTFPMTVIPYTLTAVGGANTPPPPPTVNGTPANTHLTGIAQDFDIVTTDPDGDTVRYGIDWDMNGTIHWVPASGYVPSGATQSASRIWATPGVKNFSVMAEDSNAGRSAPTPASITICGTGFTWDGVSCVAAAFSCTGGPIPANASIYAGDLTGLATNTPYTYADPDTVAKCEYSCDAGYTWNAGTGSCDASPNPTAVILSPTSPHSVSEDVSLTFEGEGHNAMNTVQTMSRWEWRMGNCNTGPIRTRDRLTVMDQIRDTQVYDVDTDIGTAPTTTRMYLRVQNQSGHWSTNCPYVEITVTGGGDVLSVCESGIPVVTGAGSTVNRPLANSVTEDLTVHYGTNGACSPLDDVTIHADTNVTDTDTPDAVDVVENVGGGVWEVTGDNTDAANRTETVTVTHAGEDAYINYEVPGMGGVCGNGTVEAGETCDDGAANGSCPAACSASCTVNACAPVCGNGTVEAGEACDDGAGNSDTCPATCSTSCTMNLCLPPQ